jgi:lipopolysaccharide transport system permease protein
LTEQTILIEASRAELHYWRDLWRYRELFGVLAWRDVAVRYKQTVLGVAWVIVQPLASVLVFTLIFGKLAKLPAPDAVPYALMVFAGLLPWQLISGSLTSAANSLTSNSGLISKVYFPRLIIPGSAVAVCFVDFAVSLLVLGGLMAVYSFSPGWRVIFLPGFLAMAFLVAAGPGLLIASMNVRYRDFRHLVPFLVQFGMYLSPVAYSASVVPEQFRWLYYLNPAAATIDGFRWCLLGGRAAMWWPGFWMAWGVIIVLIFLGVRQFRSTERTFADMI